MSREQRQDRAMRLALLDSTDRPAVCPHGELTTLAYFEGDAAKAAALWQNACDGGDMRGCILLKALQP